MTIAVIVLGVICLGLIISNIIYRRQVANICRQLAFIKSHETNKIISQYLRNEEVTNLVELINELIETEKKTVLNFKIKDARLKEVITNISHDIRTPLTSLDGYFQLLSKSSSEEECERYCRIIHERITTLTELLEQLFTYTKLQNEDYSFELDEVDVNKLLSETLLSFYDDITSLHFTPQISIPDGRIMVLGNETALRRTFQNIIKNALVHGRDELSISLTFNNKYALISFINTTDESEENIDTEQIFDRFYKADASRSHISTGLGLSIAKELTLRQKGTITASVNGSDFCIRLGLVRF